MSIISGIYSYFTRRSPTPPAKNEGGIRWRLLGSGAEKKVYVAEGDGSGPYQNKVYLVAKQTIPIFNPLQEEVECAGKIKSRIYFQALHQFFIAHGKNEIEAVRAARKVIQEFPTPELLKQGLDQSESETLTELQEDRAASQHVLNCTRYLAVDFEKESRLYGKKTWSLPRAEKNLESAIRKSKYSWNWNTNLGLARQLLEGFSHLHTAGYVHGDPKLENMLLYETGTGREVKIADWGQAKKMSEKERRIYLGNKRHMPPEILNSRKGEVFGVGLMLVRLFEEELLQDQEKRDGGAAMLLKPKGGWIDAKKADRLRHDTDQKRRRKGIERFLAMHAKAPQSDSRPVDMIGHIANSLSRSARPHCGKQPHLDRALTAYLNALQHRLEKKYPKRSSEIQQTIVILGCMLQSDPAKRISMQKAFDLINKITNK